MKESWPVWLGAFCILVAFLVQPDDYEGGQLTMILAAAVAIGGYMWWDYRRKRRE